MYLHINWHEVLYWCTWSFMVFVTITSIRAQRVSMFRDKVFQLSMEYETGMALKELTNMLNHLNQSVLSAITNNEPMPKPTHRVEVVQKSPRHFLKLPSPYKMLFSLKRLRLESYFNTVDIIELTGKIPE